MVVVAVLLFTPPVRRVLDDERNGSGRGAGAGRGEGDRLQGRLYWAGVALPVKVSTPPALLAMVMPSIGV